MNFYFIFLSLTLCQKSKKVIVSYFTDWTANTFGVNQIPYSKITHINYSFAILDADNQLVLTSEALLNQVVLKAHQNQVKVLVSIGGWTGSKYFSLMVNDAQKRLQFINQVDQLIKKFNLDGIDLDWEYPGKMGLICNTYNPKLDTLNYIVLLKQLRARLGSKLITMAVATDPFFINGQPAKDLSELAAQIDFMNIMAYDLGSDVPGKTAANAPFDSKTGNSFKQSIKSWLQVKIPKQKIVMGFPFYGKAKKLKPSLNLLNLIQQTPSIHQNSELEVPKGDQVDELWADPCPGIKKTYSGFWRWKNLRSQKVLISPLKTGKDWTRYWDSESQTPWLYNKNQNLFITYEDPISIKIKTDYLLKLGLRGGMYWAADFDNGELLQALQPIIR